MKRPVRTIAMLLLTGVALSGCIQAEDAPEAEPTESAPTPTPGEDSGDACPGPSGTPTSAPAGQTSVVNQPGSFSYSGQVTAKTATETYHWENPSARATIAWGNQGGTGSLTLSLVDPCGGMRYEKTFSGPVAQTGTVETTSSGTAGTWTVTLDFEAYTGQMGLQISSD